MQKSLLVSLALLGATSPAWAAIVVGPVQTIPATYNSRLGRPAVSDYRVAASGLPAGGVQAQLFTLATNTVTPIGSGNILDAPPVDWSVSPGGYGQNDKVGIAGTWAAFDGGKDSSSATDPAWILNGGTPFRVGGQTANENFFDTDRNGKVIWVRWNDATFGGTGFSLMYQNVAAAGPVTELVSSNPASAVYNADMQDSACANIADDGSGHITWSSGTAAKTHYVYDLNTMTNYAVYTNAAAGNVIRSRISDNGNWIVWNERSAATQGTSNRSDIMLQNVANPASPGVAVNLTNDVAKLREDPNIEITGPDTAIIVWGQRDSALVAGNYEIWAAEVSGLLTVPVMSAPVLIASETGVDLRYPDIDQNMIAWARAPEAAGAVTQYMLIPEPATIALLGLGVLGLARRR